MLNNSININLRISFFSFLAAGLLVLTILSISTFPEQLKIIFLVSLFIGLYLFLLNLFDMPVTLKILSIVLITLKMLTVSIFTLVTEDYIIFPDSYNYIENLNMIIQTADYSFGNIQQIAGTLHIGHYYYMLIPYSIFNNDFSIIIFNIFIISLSLLFFYKAFEVDFGKKIASWTFIIASLSSNLLLFGSAILKDPLVLFITSLVVYGVKTKKISLIFTFILILFLFTIRIYAGFAILIGTIFYIILEKKKKKAKRSFIKKSITVLILLLGLFIISRMQAAQLYIQISMGFVNQLFTLNTLVDTFTSFFKFFFAPLPWNSISNITIYSIVAIDSTLFLLCSIFIVMFVYKYCKYSYLRNKMSIYIIPILINAVVLGFAYGGDSARQRLGIYVFLILIIVVGFLYKNKDPDAKEGG